MSPIKLLIVEDDRDFSESIVGIASMMSVEIQTVFNLRSAIVKLHEFKPDIILLDLKLGRDSGLELFESINKIKRPILTLILTAYATKENAITALKEGAFDYIEKSLPPEEIVLALQEAHERIRLEMLVFAQQNSLEDLVKERTQELEESQEMYESLAKASPIGLIKIDDSGKCVYVNDTFVNMLGWEENEYYRFGWTKFIDEDYKENFGKEFSAFLENDETHFETEIMVDCVDGNSMYLFLEVSSFNSCGKGYVVSATNISAQKMLLPKLLEFNQKTPG